jgi:methionyl-tRNA formyltransferase
MVAVNQEENVPQLLQEANFNWRKKIPRKLSAVLFLELSSPVIPMIRAWVDEGHYVSAVVYYRQRWPKLSRQPLRWLRLRSSLLHLMRRHRIRLINMGSPDWESLRNELRRGRPEVGICFGFPRLIPDSVRSIFPHGVLNFHPALLPQYRGPKPLHWIALDNAWEKHGGVTLHEMTDEFDKALLCRRARGHGTTGGYL